MKKLLLLLSIGGLIHAAENETISNLLDKIRTTTTLHSRQSVVNYLTALKDHGQNSEEITRVIQSYNDDVLGKLLLDLDALEMRPETIEPLITEVVQRSTKYIDPATLLATKHETIKQILYKHKAFIFAQLVKDNNPIFELHNQYGELHHWHYTGNHTFTTAYIDIPNFKFTYIVKRYTEEGMVTLGVLSNQDNDVNFIIVNDKDELVIEKMFIVDEIEYHYYKSSHNGTYIFDRIQTRTNRLPEFNAIYKLEVSNTYNQHCSYIKDKSSIGLQDIFLAVERDSIVRLAVKIGFQVKNKVYELLITGAGNNSTAYLSLDKDKLILFPTSLYGQNPKVFNIAAIKALQKTFDFSLIGEDEPTLYTEEVEKNKRVTLPTFNEELVPANSNIACVYTGSSTEKSEPFNFKSYITERVKIKRLEKIRKIQERVSPSLFSPQQPGSAAIYQNLEAIKDMISSL